VKIVTKWRLDPIWHPRVVYPSTILRLHEVCAGGDDVFIGQGRLLVATKWNLLHPIWVDLLEHGTWIQSFSLSMRHVVGS
jgi:hypothetical protein